MSDVVQLRPQSLFRAILASPKPSEVCGTEDGIPILSRPLAEETRAIYLAEIREIEHSLCSTHTRKDVDRARMMMAASMVVSKSDDGDASLEAAAWSIVLDDEEMNGRIPGWVVEDAAKEFMAGKHGRFFPKVVEFMSVCKSIVARHRWAIVERRRLLDAKVVRLPKSTGASGPRLDLTESLNRMFPGSKPIKPVDLKDDEWDGRRAAFVRDVTEREDARRQREATR